jgi:hypothetical protein
MRKITLLMSLFLLLSGATRVSAQLKVADIAQAKTDGKTSLSIVLKSVSNLKNHYFMTGTSYSRVYVPDNCDFTLEFAAYNGSETNAEGKPYFRLKRGDQYLKPTNTDSGIDMTSNVSEAAYYYAVDPNGSITDNDCAEWARQSEYLIRIVRADATMYLNCGDPNMKYANGTGGFSAFFVYQTSDTDGIIEAHANLGEGEPATEWPLASEDPTASSAVAYYVKNTNTNGVVSSSTLSTRAYADFSLFVLVPAGKTHVYKLYNTKTGKYLQCIQPEGQAALEAGSNKVQWADLVDSDTSFDWWVRQDEGNTANVMDILPYGEWTLGWSWNHGDAASATSMGLEPYTDGQSKWGFYPAIMYSTDSQKKYYTIQNKLNLQKYADYTASDTQLALVQELTCGSYWYFTEATAPEGVTVPDGALVCHIYNAANGQPLKNPANGEFGGKEAQVYYVYYTENYDNGGYVLSTSVDATDNAAWNIWGGSTGDIIGNYSVGSGSVWRLNIVTDEAAMQAKATAAMNELRRISLCQAYIDECGTGHPGYFAYTAATLERAQQVMAGWNESATDMQTILANGCSAKDFVTEKTSAPQAGDYIWLRNKQYASRYLTPNNTNLNGREGDKWSSDKVWEVVAAENGVKLKNVSTGAYIKGAGTSTPFTMVDEIEATVFAWENPADWYAVFRESGSTNGYAYGHLNNSYNLVGWEKNADATQWVVLPVTRELLMQEIEHYPIGDALGQYTPSTEYATALSALKEKVNAETIDMSTVLTDLQALQALETSDNLTLNEPKQGMFLRVRTAPEHIADEPYLVAKNAGSGRIAFEQTTAEDVNTIFYLDADRKLVGYSNGYYVKKRSNENFPTMATDAMDNTTEYVFYFVPAKTGTISSYNISFNADKNRFLYTNTGLDANAGDNISASSGNGYNFRLEEVRELPVTITAAKWASFCSPVDLDIPAGITAYYATSVGTSVVGLAELTGGVLPAGLPVLLSAEEAKPYLFTVSKTAATKPEKVNAQLKGTMAKESVDANRTTYVMAMIDGRVAFGKNATGVMPGFKAYLEPDNAEPASFSISFDDFETGIRETVRENDEAVEYYDLNGCRVFFPTRGIYVTNRGEKVFIK